MGRPLGVKSILDDDDDDVCCCPPPPLPSMVFCKRSGKSIVFDLAAAGVVGCDDVPVVLVDRMPSRPLAKPLFDDGGLSTLVELADTFIIVVVVEPFAVV